MRRPALAALWLLVTTLTTTIAYWAVSTAGAEVNARPSTIALADSASTQPRTTGSSTTTPATAPRLTATTAPPATNSEWHRATINSPGGSIIVSYRPFEVRLESVAPRAGFSFEIDDKGPDRVRVELSAEDESHTLQAEWRSEGFTTDVNSSGEENDDDEDG